MEIVIAVLVAALAFAVLYAAYDTLSRRRERNPGGTLTGRIIAAGGKDVLAEIENEDRSGEPVSDVDPAFRELTASITRLVRRFSGIPLLSNILFTPANLQRTDRKLAWAGRPFGFEAEQWISVNIFIAAAVFVYGVAGFVQGWLSLTQMVLYVGLVMAAPTFWLNGRIKARHEDLDRNLPNVIDKLILASMGNQDMITTLGTVVRYTRGPLTDEIRRSLAEDRAHRDRGAREIFMAMADRCGNQNVTAFCNTIINSITVRANVTSLLKEQQEAMKEIRKANNEALINKTETYLMVSASLGIICVLIMVVAPSFLAVMQGVGSVTGG